MAIQGEESRRQLYRDLLNDKSLGYADKIRKYSFNSFQDKLLNDDKAQARLTSDLIEKGKVKDGTEFYEKYILDEVKPAPAPKAAPVAPVQQVVEPMAMEEEAYIPEPQPAVGTTEYDKQLQKQYGGMAPTLGATFGGAPAAFETPEQKKQEQISPAFKAQKLAFEEVPIASEQRRAQREFAKATKEQQKAAVMGGTGFELSQNVADENRAAAQKLKDFGYSIGALFDNVIDKSKAAEAMFGAKQRSLLTFGDKRKKAEEQEKRVKQGIVDYVDQLDQEFAAKQADYNINGNLFDVISKGQLDRIPEAFAYNLAQIGVQALAASQTGGYSMFAQIFPDLYKSGVEEIAKKTKTTPEQVIASGNDRELLSYLGGTLSGYIENLSGGILGKAMKSKGAYKFIRDKALDKIGKTKWKQAAASGIALTGTAGLEGATEGTQGLVEIAAPQIASAESFKEARENIYGELQKPSTQKRLAGDIVGGVAGGGGIAAGGRALDRILQGDYGYGDVRKAPATQRVDYDIIQTDKKLETRKKAIQAMEEAVKANPEAEGQIRQQFQKQIDAAAPTNEEVINAYESTAQLPESEEKAKIQQNLEAYMAEKGIRPEAVGQEAGLGELMRREAPEAPVAEEVVDDNEYANFIDNGVVSEERLNDIAEKVRNREQLTERETAIFTDKAGEINAIIESQSTEVAPEETIPVEEDEDLAALNEQIAAIENAPAEREMVPAAPKVRFELPKLNVTLPEGFAPALRKLGYTDEEISGMTIDQQQDIAINKTEPARAESSSKVDVAKENQRVERIAEAQKKLDEEIAAEQAAPVAAEEEIVEAVPAPAPKKGKGVTVEFPTELSVSEVKPYAEVPDNYYRPDQQLKFNQGNYYEPVRVIAHPDVIRAITIGSRLGDAQKRKTVSDSDIEFANKIAKQLGYTNDAGNGNAIMLHRAAKDLAKENRSKNEEVFMVIGNEAKAPKPTPVTPTAAPKAQPVAEKKEEKPAPKKREPKSIYEAEEAVRQTLSESPLKQEAAEQARIEKEALRKEDAAETLSDFVAKSQDPDLQKGWYDLRQLDYQKFNQYTPANKAKILVDKAISLGFITENEAKRLTGKPEKAETTPATETPQEGSDVSLPPQSKYTTEPRKMVFKDGEWKQNVGGQFVSVGESVQKQAQEAFSGKMEAKAEEVLAEPLTEQEKEITKEINITENEAAAAKQSSPKRTRKSKSVTEAIEREATNVESSGSAERAEEVIEAIEAAEIAILNNAEVDESFDEKYGFSALKFAEDYNLAGKSADLYDIYKSVTGKELDTEGNSYRPSEKAIQFAQDLLSALGREGIKLKNPLGIDGITINIAPSPVKPFSKTGTDALQELVGKDDMRPSMQGVYFDGDNMVATNGFILTVQKKTESDREIIEKAEALLVKSLSKNFAPNDARQIASKTYEEIKKNGLNGKIINLKTGEVIDQKYPDYQNVIPKKNETKTGKMSIQDLINLANGANITLSNNNKEVRPIVFSIKGDEQFEIGLDAKGLKDLLQSLQGSGAKSVTLELQSPSKGVLIKGDNGSIGLIMPVMIGEEIKNRSQPIPLETKPAPKAPETKGAEETMPTAEFTSKQEGNASTEFDGIKKPSKIKTKSFDNKYGKGAFERMQNITQNFEDIMDGLSEKIKQDCL